MKKYILLSLCLIITSLICSCATWRTKRIEKWQFKHNEVKEKADIKRSELEILTINHKEAVTDLEVKRRKLEPVQMDAKDTRVFSEYKEIMDKYLVTVARAQERLDDYQKKNEENEQIKKSHVNAKMGKINKDYQKMNEYYTQVAIEFDRLINELKRMKKTRVEIKKGFGKLEKKYI